MADLPRHSDHREALATVLRDRMVDRLVASQVIKDLAIEQAMREIPRHLFLPGVSLEHAYEDVAVPTHMEGGVAVSSASQPSMVAIMLQQAALAPGMHVLEIGAGTGYNAALLSALVGPHGSVTTLDYDPAITEEARTHLRSAHLANVDVVAADGTSGWPARAPYDLIMLTAAAYDISPAWISQLVPDGKLVIPLVLNGIEASVAFVRDGSTHLRSLSLAPCAFMRLRGSSATVSLGPTRLLSGEIAETIAPDVARLLMTRPHMRMLHGSADDLRLWLALEGVTPLTIWHAHPHRPRRARLAFWDSTALEPSLAVVSRLPQTMLIYGSPAIERAIAHAEIAQRHRTLTPIREWSVTAWPTGEPPPARSGHIGMARAHYSFGITAPEVER